MKKIIFYIAVDNCIDLITNSSSELFVIKGENQREMMIEMVNTAFKDANLTRTISDYCLVDSFTKDRDYCFDEDYEKTRLLTIFGDDKKEIIESLFSKESDDRPNFYHITIDRDSHDLYEVRSVLENLGFESLGSDY